MVECFVKFCNISDTGYYYMFYRSFILTLVASLCYPNPSPHHNCFFFFFISKNSIESAEGRNPSTKEVYKNAHNQRKETNKKVKNQ
jgi:hypothetical protein